MAGFGKDSSINRRDFFRRGAAAAAGMAAVGTGFGSAMAADELTVNGLPAVMFGNTGLKVTKVSFGGIMITEPPVLLRAIDQGINLVHTSPGYQNGRSIEAFGKAMKTHRDKVVLALKVRPDELDKWLKVLNTDYVDMLVPPLTSIKAISDPTIPEAFEKAKAAGKVGHMGFACHKNMTTVLNKAVDLGYYEVSLMAYADSDNPEFLAAAKRAVDGGMGIMTMKGLPKRGAEINSPEQKADFTSRCASMIGDGHAHTVLASMGSFQSVDFYRDMLETKLGHFDSDLERRYWAAQDGNYCSMCGKCTGICPNGVEIRRIMRYKMYNTDYGMTDYARAKYAALDSGCNGASCDQCGLCETICKRHLPVREMLSEAHATLA
jgi:uncharacterized protein